MSKSIRVVVHNQKSNEVVTPAVKTEEVVVKDKYSLYSENKRGGYGFRYDKGNY